MRVSHFIVGTKSHILDHLTDSTEVKLHDVDPWRQKTYRQYTPLWEIDEENFPGGFAELSAALERINSGLGLWFGPIGGYGEGLRLRGERGREMQGGRASAPRRPSGSTPPCAPSRSSL